MSVFTLPSYDVVFKVIKDEFTPPKDVSHEQVRAKYRLVKQHDRVGRMADTQEFTNFEFPLERISPELLAELKTVAPSALTITGDKLVIKHLYTERKMIPLNLYLDKADEQQTRLALEEYGNAIKQLAAANIFPGDMLFKNFGVTRHGRVVFYDYDEICYMTECNFRQIPPPRYPEDELECRALVLGRPQRHLPRGVRHLPAAKAAGTGDHVAAAQGDVRRQLLEDAAEQHQGGGIR